MRREENKKKRTVLGRPAAQQRPTIGGHGGCGIGCTCCFV
jgi:hypothetical protein